MTFARHQFELSAPQADGQPLIAHLEAVAERGGAIHSMLADAPPLPHGCESLWANFLELHSCRGSVGLGINRITYVDMDAFCRVTGTMLKPWEIGLIRKADTLWLTEFAPKPKADK